jgi:signal transduction histidine kinase
LKIRISDDGKGFHLNSAHQGNGIISMKNRAALMKAILKIESDQNEGTTIRLEVKIK